MVGQMINFEALQKLSTLFRVASMCSKSSPNHQDSYSLCLLENPLDNALVDSSSLPFFRA
jgi:hypothetical protein